MLSDEHTFSFANNEEDYLTKTIKSLRKWKAPRITSSINNIIRARYLSRGGIEGEDFSHLDLHGVTILPYIDGRKTQKNTNFNNTYLERRNFFYDGHTDEILCAFFNNDDSKIVTMGIDNKICVWQSETGFLFNSFIDNDLALMYAEFSPDSKQIAAVSATGEIVFLDSNSLEVIGKAIIHQNDEMDPDYYLTYSAYNGTGAYIAVASNDCNTYLIDTKIKKVVKVFIGHKREVTSVCFSADSRFIVSASQDGSVMLWDILSGELIRTFAYGTQYDKSHLYNVWNCYAVFSQYDNTIISTTTDGRIVCWNICNCTEPLYTTKNYENRINSLRISSDGSMFIVSSSDNIIDIYDSRTGICKGQMLDIGDDINHYKSDIYEYETCIYSAAFNCDGSKIVAAISDKTTRVFSTSKCEQILLIEGDAPKITNFAINNSQNTIATVIDNKIYVWGNIDTNLKLVRILYQQTKAINNILFSSNGKYLISSSIDGTGKIYSVESNYNSVVDIFHSGEINSIRISKDNNFLITASEDNSVCIWQVQTGALIKNYPYKYSQFAADFNFCANSAVMASSDGTIRIVKWTTTEEPIILSTYNNMLYEARFDYDDNLLAVGAVDGNVQLININNGDCFQLKGHKDNVYKIIFNPVFDLLLTISDITDKRAILWNKKSCEKLVVFGDDNKEVSVVAFSNTGNLLLVVYEYEEAEIIDVETLRVIHKIYEKDSFLGFSSFSSDDKKIYITVNDHYIYAYDLEQHSQILECHSVLNHNYNEKLTGCNFVNAIFDETFSELDISLLHSYADTRLWGGEQE